MRQRNRLGARLLGGWVRLARAPIFAIRDAVTSGGDKGSTKNVVQLDRAPIPTYLFNGVCGAANCPNGPKTGCVDCKYANWDLTLVQLLDTYDY